MAQRSKTKLPIEDVNSQTLRGVIDLLPNPIMIIDNGLITYANQAVSELTDYDQTEIIGQAYSFFEGLSTSKIAAAKLSRAVESNKYIRLTIQNYRKDSTEFWNDLTMKPISDGAYIAVLNSVTHPMPVEKDLSGILAEQEINRQRIKLLASQKAQLIELNKLKDDFVSIASHQLRTPATTVKQYIGMIIEGFVGDVDGQQLELLQAAYKSNERQLDVINDLLHTARIDTRNYRLTLKNTNLTKLIKQVINHVEPMVKLRDQKIIFDNSRSIIAAIDGAEISLVLENLIENASKYSKTDTDITISVKKATSKLYISVKDEGVGVSPVDQKKIFDKFTRIDNDLSDTVSGNGLGLYWSKRILRLHKGSIKIDSQLGGGSTFTMVLPA